MAIYDITRTIRPTLAVWPGDTAYSVSPALHIDKGASVNLTTITMSPHTGTHADAYFHYESAGSHPSQMLLDGYLGRARVVMVDQFEGALLPNDFMVGALDGVERLLIRSHISTLPDEQFPEQFPYLSVELIELLARQGAKLIGLDSPSVDAYDSKTLPCHHALRRVGMVNLESLLLRDVPEGDYELIALPLKLDLACGSPVRAILRSL